MPEDQRGISAAETDAGRQNGVDTL
ncbi:MAG: hypothetical protein QG672_2622, partial [Pseudomonadota bacterium]|nr:hypothetical protein [Pseudomonadota bacterium]